MLRACFAPAQRCMADFTWSVWARKSTTCLRCQAESTVFAPGRRQIWQLFKIVPKGLRTP